MSAERTLLDGAISLPGYLDPVAVAGGVDSVIYRAWHGRLGRYVAVKVLVVDDPAAVRRFERELEITVTLGGARHPHVVGVLDSGSTGAGRPYLVMEFYDLGSLHDRLRAAGPLPVQVAAA